LYVKDLLTVNPITSWTTTAFRPSTAAYSVHSQLPSTPSESPKHAVPWCQGTNLK